MGRLRLCTHRYASLWCALALLVPSVCTAHDALTLPAAIEATLARAPQARAAQAAAHAADAGVEIAQQRPNPSLSLEAENVDGTGPYADAQLRETTAILELPIELGGKRSARIHVASAEHAGAAADAAAADAELVGMATESFIRVIEAQRRADLARDRLTLASEVLRAAQVRVQAGKASPLDEQRAEVERTLAQVDAEATARRLANADALLERLTGVRATAVAPWFDMTETDTSTDVETSPALMRADADVAAAQARVDLARRSRVPDITVSAGVRRFDETRDTAAVFAVSVPLPLLGRLEKTEKIVR